jgi:hypothetical protein
MPDASPIAREVARQFLGSDRYYSDDYSPAGGIPRLEQIVDQVLRCPAGELRGSYPVLLYLSSEADRDELIALLQAANPRLTATKL